MKYSIRSCPRDGNKKGVTSRFMELYSHQARVIDLTAFEKDIEKIITDFRKNSGSDMKTKGSNK
jgi:hypothetical protein